MLANLVPGVRDLRSPLAAGYIWLAAIWVIWGRHLPDGKHSTGLLKQIQELSKAMGRPTTIGMISFSAYLVGVLSVAVSDRLIKLPADRRNGLGSRLFRFRPTHRLGVRLLNSNNRIRKTLRFAIMSRMERVHVDYFTLSVADTGSADEFGSELRSRMMHPSRQNRAIHEILSISDSQEIDEVTRHEFREEVQRAAVDQLLDDLIADLPLVPARLLGRDADLYDAYDRLRAEAQFRAAVVMPLIVLSFSLSWAATSELFLLLILLAIVLFITALQRHREAEYLLAESIRAQRVETPALKILNKIADSEREAGQSNPQEFQSE